ncbi:MAG: SDR family oxidoreductase [Dehalococcoidia bacterium]|nr:SDR family oxidoreductase [Dehalococcoidia bacterium]
MGKKLAGKVAIVTGAGNGIGRAEAIALARQGACVVVNDLGGATDGTGRSFQAADNVVMDIREKGGTAVANYDSVADPCGADRIIQSAIDNFGRIDILVNNAGIVNTGIVFNIADNDFNKIIKVHLYGHFYCIRSACRLFKQQKSGSIINTSSTAGLGLIGGVHYSAAKEGIIGLTRSVAMEMARYNVTCNAIRPAAITRMTQAATSEKENMMTHQYWMDVLASPMVMKSTPEDIAPFVVFLAGDEAAGLTGHTFYVCRGHISLYSEPARIKSIYSDDTWTLDQIRQDFSLIKPD